MLDALRHHKPTPPGGDASRRGAAGHNVPAPLAQAFGRPQPDESASTGKRLGLALVLVGVTALLLWQVAAMNDLLPAGPFSRLFRPVTAERSRFGWFRRGARVQAASRPQPASLLYR